MKNYKHFLRAVMVALMISETLCAYGRKDFQIDYLYYEIVSYENHTCYISDCIEKEIPSEVIIPETVIYNSIEYSVVGIYPYVFKYGSKIKSVHMGKNIQFVGLDNFEKCVNAEAVYIEDLTAWCNIDFENDSANPLRNAHNLYLNGELLTEIEVPDGVKTLKGAFCGSNMTSIKLPNSLICIGISSFQSCSGLTHVEIPESVNELGYSSFWFCPNIKEVICLNPIPPIDEYGAFTIYQNSESVLKVPAESIDLYKMAKGWKNFKNITAYQTCENPTISILNGKLYFESVTKDSKVEYNISSEDFKSGTADNNTLVPVTGVYNITAYATAKGYGNSETVSATLVWVNPTIETDNIINMEAKKAVLIRSNGNGIVFSGTERGERIELYTIGGVLMNSVSAQDNETVIPCNLQKGEVVIVKYGDKAIKCRL